MLQRAHVAMWSKTACAPTQEHGSEVSLGGMRFRASATRRPANSGHDEACPSRGSNTKANKGAWEREENTNTKLQITNN